MDNEQESADEPSAELDGQLSINDYLIELGEEPVLKIVVAEPTDEEIAAFFEGEANNQ